MDRYRARSLGQAFSFAGRGLAYAWRTQPNLRLHTAAAGAVFMLARWLELPRAEKAAVGLAAGLVICVEVLNTAVEVAVNLVTTEIHPLAGRAKDIAAAAVLLAAASALGTAGIVLGPHASRIPEMLAVRWAAAPWEVAATGFVVLILGLSGLRR